MPVFGCTKFRFSPCVLGTLVLLVSSESFDLCREHFETLFRTGDLASQGFRSIVEIYNLVGLINMLALGPIAFQCVI